MCGSSLNVPKLWEGVLVDRSHPTQKKSESDPTYLVFDFDKLVRVRLNFCEMDSVARVAKYECLLFDMDDTLYPLSLGLNLACRKNIEDYMLHHLPIDESQVPKMCLELYKEYGTTMAGLKVLGFNFDNDEYHAYVHGRLPYEKLTPDPVLRNLLLSIPQRKIIFTNADRAHAAQVLSKMGLEDCFEGVICFETLNPPLTCHELDNKLDSTSVMTNQWMKPIDHEFLNGSCLEIGPTSKPKTNASILCKPSLEAIEAAIRIANIDPERTIFFDDSARNVAAGKAAGLCTVIVGSSVLVPGADLALESIHNIKEALPELWDDGNLFDTVIASTASETVVLA